MKKTLFKSLIISIILAIFLGLSGLFYSYLQNQKLESYKRGWRECYDFAYQKAVLEVYYQKSEYVVQQDHGIAILWKREGMWKDIVAERDYSLIKSR